MKHALAILSAVILITAGLGCSKLRGDDASKTGNVANTTAIPASSTVSKDITGTYDITGLNENGAGAYKGTLVVTDRGDVSQLS